MPKGAVSFTSKNQGFAVWFPGKGVNQRLTPLKNADYLYSAKANIESVTYKVSVIPRPLGSATQILDRRQKGTLKAPDKKLLRRENIRLNGFPGRDLWVSYADGRAMSRSRSYITPKYSYGLFTTGSTIEMQKQRAQIDKMFDSFRILPQ